jgi:hypothetical protein
MSDSAALFPAVTEFLKANPWALPLGGALLGLAGGSPEQTGTQTTTTSSIPPELQPYLSQLFGTGGAGGLLSGMTGGAAGGTNGVLSGLAGNQLAGTIAGQYMLPNTWNPFGGMSTNVPTNPYFGQNNPYMQQALDRASGDVTSKVMGQFNKSAGAFGGSANQEILARELSNLQNQFRFQDYGLQAQLGEADVNRRTNTSLADILRNSGLWNTDMARNTQNYQQERSRQFGAATAAPDWYSSLVQSQFSPYSQYANLLKGWGSSTSQPVYSSPLGSAFGGALTGFSLSKMFG